MTLPIVEKLREAEVREVSRDGFCREELVTINRDGTEAADTIEQLYQALDTIRERAEVHKRQAERAGRPSQAQWRGIEAVADAVLAKARGEQ